MRAEVSSDVCAGFAPSVLAEGGKAVMGVSDVMESLVPLTAEVGAIR